MKDTIKDIFRSRTDVTKKDISRKCMQLWCDTNGIISLYNSRLLHEIEIHPDKTIKCMIEELYSCIIS